MKMLDYSAVFYESCLVKKSRSKEGFDVYLSDEDPDIELEGAKQFTDSRKKFLVDNHAPFGHFMTNWLYTLIVEIEKTKLPPKDVLILISYSPKTDSLHLNHMSSVTQYVADRFIEKGYGVDFVDSEFFYVTNYYHFPSPIFVPEVLLPSVVGGFLQEGITTSNYGRKIYLSRSKTTTSNGNNGVRVEEKLDRSIKFKNAIKQVRDEYKYKFSDRIDDEERLEQYLKSLGFEILTPEDFESYAEQLNVISEAKILASITSSAMYSIMVLKPGAKVLEICSPAPTIRNGKGEPLPEGDIFTDHFRAVALSKGHVYIGIPCRPKKVDDVINYIESTPEIKLMVSS